MEKRPLLSIVVPTKDRYYYLEKLVELIDSFKSDEIEMVIQDNSDDNSGFLEYLSRNNYPFIKYDHKQGQIPMSTNSDYAILNSSGEYVCFIGDDDGVTKGIIGCVQMMKELDIEALQTAPASYCWPEVGRSRFLQMGGRISWKGGTCKLEKWDSEQTLYRIAKKGFINRGDLPLVYHGIVRRDILDKIYKIGGTYFPGNSPDIANGVALSLVVKNYYYYDKIITISGASRFHGGGVGTLGKKHPEIEDIKWFKPGSIENWDNRIPRIAEGECIWCDSAIKALRYMKREDIETSIDFENLYLSFAVCHRDIKNYSRVLSKNKLIFDLKYYLLLGKRYYKGIVELILSKFNKIVGHKSKLGFNNIIEASQFCENLN